MCVHAYKLISRLKGNRKYNDEEKPKVKYYMVRQTAVVSFLEGKIINV